MPILRIGNVAKAGVNSDVSPWELGQEFLTYGINFRIRNDKVTSFGGYETWTTSPVAFFPGFMMPVKSSSDFWLVAGRNSIRVFDGQNWHDISNPTGYPGMGPDDELNWTGCMLGRIPVINNPQHYPEYWNPQSAGTAMQSLPFDAGNTWQAKGYTFQVIRSFKNFLIAMNLQEGSTSLPEILRWSHPADGGSIPVSWDETDPTLLAGKSQPLGSRIIDGHSLRDAFAVYSEDRINVMDYTGDTFVFRFRELSSTIGLINKRCVTEVKGVHMILGDGDIVTNDGNSLNSLIHKRLRRRITANMSTGFYSRSFVARNTVTKEVWFCVPEDRAEYPNVAYIYNWRDDTWSIRDLPEVSHVALGPRSTPAQSWDETVGSWDEQQGVWGSRERTPLDDFMMAVRPDSSIAALEDVTINEGSNTSTIERTDFPLEGHESVTTITRLYPHMEGTEPVQIQVGGQEYAGGPIRWKPSVTFTPGQDRKIDVRSTGKLHAWRVKSSQPGNWAFSGMDIEYVVDGRR